MADKLSDKGLKDLLARLRDEERKRLETILGDRLHLIPPRPDVDAAVPAPWTGKARGAPALQPSQGPPPPAATPPPSGPPAGGGGGGARHQSPPTPAAIAEVGTPPVSTIPPAAASATPYAPGERVMVYGSLQGTVYIANPEAPSPYEILLDNGGRVHATAEQLARAPPKA